MRHFPHLFTIKRQKPAVKVKTPVVVGGDVVVIPTPQSPEEGINGPVKICVSPTYPVSGNALLCNVL